VSYTFIGSLNVSCSGFFLFLGWCDYEVFTIMFTSSVKSIVQANVEWTTSSPTHTPGSIRTVYVCSWPAVVLMYREKPTQWEKPTQLSWEEISELHLLNTTSCPRDLCLTTCAAGAWLHVSSSKRAFAEHNSGYRYNRLWWIFHFNEINRYDHFVRSRDLFPVIIFQLFYDCKWSVFYD